MKPEAVAGERREGSPAGVVGGCPDAPREPPSEAAALEEMAGAGGWAHSKREEARIPPRRQRGAGAERGGG